MAGLALIDRREHREAIDDLLDAVRAGMSRTLVLQGEAGIGKTALLDYAIELARDFRLARVVGVESEMELGFAGLHQLLLPFLGGMDRLPDPQREALGCAFGLAAGRAPDPFLVGLSALTLLSNSAEQRPLLCVIDDAQWLDDESVGTLSFVARRLHADRAGLLFGLREPFASRVPLDGLPHLEVGALPTNDARELLASIATGPIDDRVTGRIVAETRGNPLALAELVLELTAEQLSGKAPLPEPLPVGRTLQESFLRRSRSLPPESQTLLLLAAAEPSGDPVLFRRAADALHLDWEAAMTPEAEVFLRLEPIPAFRHPLVRSAVYHGATGAERRRVHRALAEATDGAVDPDRRAWHFAAATVGPDASVADELDRSAEVARSRGGYAAAASFLEHAADLTPDSASRADRTLRAADAELTAGAPDRAQALLDAAGTGIHDDEQRVRAERLQGAIWFALGQVRETPTILLRAACALEGVDRRAAVDTMLEAQQAALYAGRLARGTDAFDVARAAARVVVPDQPHATAAELLLEGIAARLTSSYDASVPIFREAIARMEAETDLRWQALTCAAAGELLDDSLYQGVAAGWVERARDQGALTTLPVALNFLSWSDVIAGRFAAAEAGLAEARDILALTGFRGIAGVHGPAELLLAAWRGDEKETRAAASAIGDDARDRGQGADIAIAQSSLAVLELGRGEYAAALSCAADAYDEDIIYAGTLVLPDLVEAAVRCGEGDVAASALERLAERALATGTPWALGLLARSKALLADDDDAEALYRTAIDHLQRSDTRPDLGRAHLLYGEWLRRRQRRTDARDELHLAVDLFARSGAEGFAARGRRELIATGERARRRVLETSNDLTPQERNIAQLAASGETNAEIATQLFISASTVDYHLRKVYRKLSITSRRRLKEVLAD